MDHFYPRFKQLDNVGQHIEAVIELTPAAAKLCESLSLDVASQQIGRATHALVLRPLDDYQTVCHSREQFALDISNTQITVYADTDRAASYGIKAVLDMQRNQMLTTGRCTDWPAMERRGIIEGFYGPPWRLHQELDAIRQLWENRMNTYIYSPKDDVYHRERWNELYPKEHLTNLVRLQEECQKYQIDLYYMLAPGLSMTYSSEDDFASLITKYKQIYSLGIRQFGLLLDDIPEELTHESDRRMFGSYGEAHNYVCVKAYHALKAIDSSITFTVCPTIYRGSPSQEYITNMGRALPEDVSLFWTGPKTCSFDLSAAHTRDFIKHTGHRPLYWDNYPVNDAEMVMEMHLAPIANRDYELAELSNGIVANTMEHKEASMLSIITYAQFMWEPNRYDKEQSFVNAVEQCLGSAYCNAAQILMEFCYLSCIRHTYHIKLDRMLRCHTAFSREELVRYLEFCAQELLHLQRHCENQDFIHEVAPWLNKSLTFCTLVCDVLLSNTSTDVLRQRIDSYLRDEYEVCKHEANLLYDYLG